MPMLNLTADQAREIHIELLLDEHPIFDRADAERFTPEFAEGCFEHTSFMRRLRKALSEPGAFDFLDERPLDQSEARAVRDMTPTKAVIEGLSA